MEGLGHVASALQLDDIHSPNIQVRGIGLPTAERGERRTGTLEMESVSGDIQIKV